jgi:hypothetical protein
MKTLSVVFKRVFFGELLSREFECIHVEPNHNSLFAATGVLVSTHYLELKARVVQHMRENRDDFSPFLAEIDYNGYLNRIETPGFTPGDLELLALSRYLNRPLHIFELDTLELSDGKFKTSHVIGEGKPPIFLMKFNGFYNALRRGDATYWLARLEEAVESNLAHFPVNESNEPSVLETPFAISPLLQLLQESKYSSICGLDFSGVTIEPPAWRELIKQLPQMSITHLTLHEMEMDQIEDLEELPKAFLEQLKGLHISLAGFWDDESCQVMNALLKATHLETIDLPDKDLTEEGLIKIFDGVTPTFVSINLGLKLSSETSFLWPIRKQDYGKILSDQNNSALLDLEGVFFEKRDWYSFCDHLNGLSQIEELRLGRSNFSYDFLSELALRSGPFLSKIKRLVITDYHCEDSEKYMDSLITLLNKCPLEELSLNSCGLDDEKMSHLLEPLKEKKLEKLFLNGNNLTEESLCLLRPFLEVNNNIFLEVQEEGDFPYFPDLEKDLKDIDLKDMDKYPNYERELLFEGILRKQFSVMNVPGDGNCLFSSVSLLVDGYDHLSLRAAVIAKMKEEDKEFTPYFDEEETFEQHLEMMEKPKEWGGNHELMALSMLFRHPIHVFESISATKTVEGDLKAGIIINDAENPPIYLFRIGESHYKALKKIV